MKNSLSQRHEDGDGEGRTSTEQGKTHRRRRLEHGVELESKSEQTITDCLQNTAPPPGRFPLGDHQNTASIVFPHLRDDTRNDLGRRMEVPKPDAPELGKCVDPCTGGGPVSGEERHSPVRPLTRKVVHVEVPKLTDKMDIIPGLDPILSEI